MFAAIGIPEQIWGYLGSHRNTRATTGTFLRILKHLQYAWAAMRMPGQLWGHLNNLGVHLNSHENTQAAMKMPRHLGILGDLRST